MLKTLFTEQELSEQLHKSGVSDLMIESGIEPIAYWVFNYITTETNLELSKDMLKIRDAKPAWSCEQLWDYLPLKLEDSHDPFKLHIYQDDSLVIKVNYVSTTYTGRIRFNNYLIGKLTDPNLPAQMLLKLQEMGLL